MAKAKTNRPDHYEKKIVLKEGVTFNDLVRISVKAPKKEQKDKK